MCVTSCSLMRLAMTVPSFSISTLMAVVLITALISR